MIEQISKFAFVAVFNMVRSSLFILAIAVSGRVERDADGLARIELVITSSIRKLFQVRRLQTGQLLNSFLWSRWKHTEDFSPTELERNTDPRHGAPKHEQLSPLYPNT